MEYAEIKINLYGVNGRRIVDTDDGRHFIPRDVLERNVFDIVEGSDDYGNLSFDDALTFVELATTNELALVLVERFPLEKVAEVLNREEAPSQDSLEVFT